MHLLKRLLRPLVIRLRRLILPLQPRRLAATFGFLAAVFAQVRRRRCEERLTVAVDISSFWEPLTGIGWYLYRLLEQLADRDDLRLRLYGPFLLEGGAIPPPVVELPAGAALERIAYQPPQELSLSPGLLFRIFHWLRPVLAAADANRVVFAPNYLVPGTFRLCRGALAATVHDLGFREVPWTLQRETLEELTCRMQRTFRRARQVITPSRAVAAEIIAAGLAPAERITAIHHGPGQLAGTEPGELPAGLGPDFALYVGTIEPRKNLGVVLQAWSELRGRGFEPPELVLCGRLGWKSETIRPQLERGTAEGWLRHLGYVDNPTLAALYQAARFVVFPSLYEGFGLPAVEAQQAGAAVLLSDLPVFREVAGRAALYAPPDDPQAWAVQIQRLVEDHELRQELARRGRESALRFSWPEAAGRTLEVLRRAAREGSAGALEGVDPKRPAG